MTKLLISILLIILIVFIIKPNKAKSKFLQWGEYDYPYNVKPFDDLVPSINTANPFL